MTARATLLIALFSLVALVGVLMMTRQRLRTMHGDSPAGSSSGSPSTRSSHGTARPDIGATKSGDRKVTVEKRTAAPDPAKIQFDLKQFRADGLRGPDDGLTSLSYQFKVPADEAIYREVQRIDPEVRISPPRTPGEEAFCLSSTSQPHWREVLMELSSLPYVSRIEECFFE